MPPQQDRAHGTEDGQTMAEYGVVLAVISLAVVGVFAAFSESVQHAVARAAALLT